MKKLSLVNLSLVISCGFMFACSEFEPLSLDSKGVFGTKSLENNDGILLGKSTSETSVSVGKVALYPPPKPNSLNVMPFNESENNAKNLVINRQLRLSSQGIDALPEKTTAFSKDDFSIKQQAAPNPNWGSLISQVSNPVGNRVATIAAHEVKTISFPSATYDQLLYAPTLMAPNNSIAESTLYYWRPINTSTTTRTWGVWDHVQGISTPAGKGGWWYLEEVNANFLSKYVRTQADGKQYFYTEVERVSGASHSWRVMLFNYVTGAWEVKYAQDRGVKGGPYTFGWDIHEPKFFSGNTVYCPTLPSIKMKELQVWNGSVWNNVTGSFGSKFLGDVTCGGWTYNMLNNFNEWIVN